jgi:hypothetical protein
MRHRSTPRPPNLQASGRARPATAGRRAERASAALLTGTAEVNVEGEGPRGLSLEEQTARVVGLNKNRASTRKHRGL